MLAVGRPEDVGPLAGATAESMPDMLLMPGLVNAHAHLDLTSIGPRPFDGGFAAWIAMIIAERRARAGQEAASVTEGVRLSRAGGTAFIGDIAGTRGLQAVAALRAAGLPGVSYVEVFGIGRGEADGEAFVRGLAERLPLDEAGVRLGVSPHAPYTCGDRLYRACAESGLAVATHLSESPEELEFVRTASGPFADLLRRLSGPDDSIRPWHCSPVRRLTDVLRQGRMSMAHGNYLDDDDVQSLVQVVRRCTGTGPMPGLVYCPRSSAYFGHPREGASPHRYRELLQLGVPVALGTDSLICLDTPDRISVIDEMRMLHRRDGTDPLTLLAMATVHGAAVLGVDPGRVTLRPGSRPEGVIAVQVAADEHDAVRSALRASVAPTWVLRR
ncbi:MAG: hypothetical protein EBX36_12400, partial [Planctomycetia bacterium]|nr:hypothetical protein [Planctomycetia bacterium]